MRWTRLIVAVTAASGILVQSPAANAAVPKVTESALVEGLCPGRDGNPLAFGITEDAVDEAALAGLNERATAAGFDKARLQYTSWSNKLYGVEYVLDVPGGDDLSEWGEQFGKRMIELGWAFSEDPFTSLSAGRYEKEVEGDEEHRILGIELGLHSINRGITLLCADAELQLADKDERDGALAQGSPRPVAPKPQPPVEDFLARLDCSDPGLLADFAKAQDLDDAGVLVEARLSPPELNSEANYQYRLVKWLRWRMLLSDRIDENRLFEIERKVAEEVPEDFNGNFIEMMGALEAVMSADKLSDPAALCTAYRNAVGVVAKQSADEARRNAALAIAYEAEARRLAIPLD